MRTFLSYDIEEPAFLKKIQELQGQIAATGADLKLVQTESMHFTIRFLGEIDEQDKQQIIEKLRGQVEGFELDVHFKGVGSFPSEKRISVVWVGIDPLSAKKLEEHANLVNSKLASLANLHKDTFEGFSPHVTIARVRSAKNKEKLIEALNLHRNDDLGSTKIKNLRLKLSELTPSGPKYSDLHVFEK